MAYHTAGRVPSGVRKLPFHARYSISPQTSGSSALSPDGCRLITHNLKDGLDLYQLSPQEHLHHFKYRSASEDYVVSTAFLHGGTAVIGGSSSGEVLIWETNSREIFQVLGHGCMFKRCCAFTLSDPRLLFSLSYTGSYGDYIGLF